MRRPLIIAIFVSASLAPLYAMGAYIVETAPLGAGGQASGNAVYYRQFVGARFHLDHPVEVEAVGGHFYGWGTLFAAIAPLATPGGFPIGTPYTFVPTAAVTFSPPPAFASADISVPLSLLLEPGDYALVFGSGRFGATGSGATPVSGVVPNTTFFFTDERNVWREPLGLLHRFTVIGTVVPEPSSIALAAVALVGLIALSRRKRA